MDGWGEEREREIVRCEIIISRALEQQQQNTTTKNDRPAEKKVRLSRVVGNSSSMYVYGNKRNELINAGQGKKGKKRKKKKRGSETISARSRYMKGEIRRRSKHWWFYVHS